VSARIHHHNAETVPQQKLSRTENTGAVVRNSVEENYPINVWLSGANLPAA